MQKIHIKNTTLGNNPLANVLVVIVGAIIIGVSLVLGFFAFLALSAAVLVAAVIMNIRSWWIGRKAPRQHSSERAKDGDLIEGEFHVVKRDKNS